MASIKDVVKCKLCNKKVKRKGLGQHIRRSHDISQKEYYDQFYKKENEDICPVCKKPVDFINVLRGYKKHCSHYCAMNNPETRQNISNATKKAMSKVKKSSTIEIKQKPKEIKKPKIKKKIQPKPKKIYKSTIDNPEQFLIEHFELNNISYIQNYSSFNFIYDFYLIDKDLYIDLISIHNLEDKLKIAKDYNLNYIILQTNIDIEAWTLLDYPVGQDWKHKYSWYTDRKLFCEEELPNKYNGTTILYKIAKIVHFDIFYEKELEFWNNNSIYNSKELNEQLKLYKNREHYINKGYKDLTNFEILRGLNISGKIRSYTCFNNKGMLEFIDNYNIKEIYDPCAGWGERMLTCAQKGVKYLGFDVNERLLPGYNRIIKKYNLIDQEFYLVKNKQQNIYNYDSLFTCPPYWNEEIYSSNGAENLDYIDFLSWWKSIIKESNCNIIAYQINQKYKENMNKQILDLGYALIDEINLNQQSSHFTRKKNGLNLKKEYESIQIFIKGD